MIVGEKLVFGKKRGLDEAEDIVIDRVPKKNREETDEKLSSGSKQLRDSRLDHAQPYEVYRLELL